MSFPLAKRLCCKTKLAQRPVVGVFLDEAEEKSNASRSAYLVTFPHPKRGQSKDGVVLVAPETKSKKELLDNFLDCCAKPVYKDGRNNEHEPLAACRRKDHPKTEYASAARKNQEQILSL